MDKKKKKWETMKAEKNDKAKPEITEAVCGKSRSQSLSVM